MSSNVREANQGRPIISELVGDLRNTAVGDRSILSNAKTFPDFLALYVGDILSHDWIGEQLRRSEVEMHPFVRWQTKVKQLLEEKILVPGQPVRIQNTGALLAFLTLAYDLYSLEHNVGFLESHLLARFRNRDQFLGVLTEFRVAAMLVRAGFSLKFEDESDSDSTHGEYVATRRVSGTGFLVECKTCHWSALPSNDEKGRARVQVITARQIRAALSKELPDGTVIVIELALPDEVEGDAPSENRWWSDAAQAAITTVENEFAAQGKPMPLARIIVFNHPYHLQLDSTRSIRGTVLDGFGTTDFRNGRATTSAEAHRLYRNHGDFMAFWASVQRSHDIPQTFGRRHSMSSGGDDRRRYVIGGACYLKKPDGSIVSGVLTNAWVLLAEKHIQTVVRTDDGTEHSGVSALSDAELHAYLERPDSFFQANETSVEFDDLMDLYLHLIEQARDLPREVLLHEMVNHPEIERLRTMSRDALAEELCEITAHQLATNGAYTGL